MFIQTEQTPNPASLRFLPGRPVMAEGTADFPDADAAGSSPLARALFAIDGVAGVFLGRDFITVSKAEGRDWFALKPALLGAIMDHFAAGRPVIEGGMAADRDGPAPGDADEDEVVSQIRELLDTRVRPQVAQDGGDIVFRGFDHGVVYLHLQGSCSGCPSSTLTLKAGIENMLRHYVPEVVEVRAVA